MFLRIGLCVSINYNMEMFKILGECKLSIQTSPTCKLVMKRALCVWIILQIRLNPSVLAWVTPVTQHFSDLYCTFMKCSWEQWLQVTAVYTLYNKIIQFVVSNAWVQTQRKWFISLVPLVNQKNIVVNVSSTLEITFFYSFP